MQTLLKAELILLYILIILLLMVWWVSEARPRQLELTTPEGRVFTVPENTLYTASNIFGENLTVVLTPEGGGLAEASVKDGTGTTRFYGKRITYLPNREDFLLEGEARIEADGYDLSGPSKIEFFPQRNLMVLEGTPSRPAEFVTRGERPIQTRAEVIHFLFEYEDGKRKLETVQVVRGHRGSSIMPRGGAAEKSLMRKLSGAPNQ